MRRPIRAVARHLASTVCAALLAGSATAVAAGPAGAAMRRAALAPSASLWATINRCSPHDAPDSVGLRASMPGDGHAGDSMYIRFRLQYFDSSKRAWQDLGGSADSGYLLVGSAATTRQDGRTFTLAPARSAFRLRGAVDFQWRRGARTIFSTERLTSAGHRSAAGADPAGFSAATCLFR